MDVAEMTPVSTKASAQPVKGFQGGALAEVFIKDAEKKAAKIAKEAESMKDKLKKLAELPDTESHQAFQATMEARRVEIKKAAEAAEVSLSEFLEADPASNSIQVTVSLWLKLSRAVHSGWKPEYDKPWAEISLSATDHLKAAQGKSSPAQQGRGRPATPVLDKVKNFVKANLPPAQMSDEGEVVNKDARKLADVVQLICMGATLEELREVAAVVQTMLENKEKETEAAEAAAKASAKASKTSKESPRKAAPTPSKSSDLNADDLISRGKQITEEHAAAKKHGKH